MSSQNLVVSELLTFLQHQLDVMDEVSVTQICTSNFIEEEIRSAKVLLYTSLDIVDRMPSHRRDEKGERSLQDMIRVFKETDPDDVPIFVAKELRKLPPITFDHVDVTRLLKDIQTLKISLAEMNFKLEASQNTISDLRTEVAQHVTGTTCNVIVIFNYLLRLELFEKSLNAYNEALRWDSSDVRSLLGRSLARAKSTHYAGALADAAQAAALEPRNSRALQIRAQTEYEKCAFERALVLAHRGQRIRRFPPDFAECVRCAQETVRECTGKMATNILASAVTLLSNIELKRQSVDEDAPVAAMRRRRMQPQQEQQVQLMSRAEKQKAEQISRLMASKYLERMAHDKYFLTALCKDERLISANKQGSQKLQELANKALADVEKRQAVLRERRPLYAARASEAAARARLSHARKEQLKHTQRQHATDARRLIQTAQSIFEEHDTARCLEHAEFGMEQITRKPSSLLPGKDKFLQKLQDIVANAFLDQKRVRESMSESDRERRAFILLGMSVSREPSRDSVLRVRPPAPPRDAKVRLRTLERALSMSTRVSERCYLLHELARLNVDTKQALKARVFASKCQTEARASNQRVWLLNALFLLARCHLLQNNRPEARAVLLEAAGLARSYGHCEVAEFYDTCVNVSLEGEVVASDAPLEKREKDLVSLMQDDDLRLAAKHLFKGMSLIPAARRFSIMPGTRVEDNGVRQNSRRLSIMPKVAQPTRITHRSQHPLGYQDFDI